MGNVYTRINEEDYDKKERSMQNTQQEKKRNDEEKCGGNIMTKYRKGI